MTRDMEWFQYGGADRVAWTCWSHAYHLRIVGFRLVWSNLNVLTTCPAKLKYLAYSIMGADNYMLGLGYRVGTRALRCCGSVSILEDA